MRGHFAVALVLATTAARAEPHFTAGVDVGVQGRVHPTADERANEFTDLRAGVEFDLALRGWRAGVETSIMIGGPDESSLNLRVRGSYVSSQNWSASLALGSFTCTSCQFQRDPHFLARAEFDVWGIGLFVETRTIVYDAGARYRPYGTEVVISSGVTTNNRHSWMPAAVLLGLALASTISFGH